MAPSRSSPLSTSAEIEKGVLQGNSPAAGWLKVPSEKPVVTMCLEDSCDSDRLVLVPLRATECASHSDSLH